LDQMGLEQKFSMMGSGEQYVVMILMMMMALYSAVHLVMLLLVSFLVMRCKMVHFQYWEMISDALEVNKAFSGAQLDSDKETIIVRILKI